MGTVYGEKKIGEIEAWDDFGNLYIILVFRRTATTTLLVGAIDKDKGGGPLRFCTSHGHMVSRDRAGQLVLVQKNVKLFVDEGELNEILSRK